MNFLKLIRIRSTQRVSQQAATDSTRNLIDWLRKKISVEEAETDNPGITDDRVSRFPLAARPFGFVNRQWEILKSEIKPGDELWSFTSPGDSWQRFTGRMGVALLRDGKVIDMIVTEMN